MQNRAKLWFVFGGAAADAGALDAFAAELGGGVALLHPGFSDRSTIPIANAEHRAIGVDVVMMNSEDEEWAWREASRFAEIFTAALSPVPFMGADLTACSLALLGLRLERILVLERAIDRVAAEGYSHIIVWFRNFSRFDLATLMARSEPEHLPHAVLKLSHGALIPQPRLFQVHAFPSVARTVISRLQDGVASRAAILADASPVESGLSIALLTRVDGYLREAASILEALNERQVPFRLILLNEQDCRLLPAPAAPIALVGRHRPGSASIDVEKILSSLGDLFKQLSEMGTKAPEMPNGLAQLCRHILQLAQNASVFRGAYLACLDIERLGVWLDHDRTKCLFYYPSRTHLDPALRDMMEARGGVAATSLMRAVTEEFRNFYLPPSHALATLGNEQAAIARKRGFKGDLAPVGSLQADSAFKRVTRESARRETLSQARRSDRLLLVATSGFDRPGERRWLRWLAAQVRDDPELSMIFKPHPSQLPGAYHDIVAPLSDRVRVKTDGDIHALITAADAVLTDVSHVGSLAVLRGRPLAVVNVSGVPFPYNRFDAKGLATRITTEEEMAEFTTGISRGAPSPTSAELRLDHIRAEFTAGDGRSGERMVAFLRDCLDAPGYGAGSDSPKTDFASA